MQRLFAPHALRSLPYVAVAPLAAPAVHLTAGSQLPLVVSLAWPLSSTLTVVLVVLILLILAGAIIAAQYVQKLNRLGSVDLDSKQAPHARPDDVAGDVGASVLDTIAAAAKSVLSPRRAREASPDASRRPPGAITGAPAPKAPPFRRPPPQLPWAGGTAPTTEQKEEAARGQPASPAPPSPEPGGGVLARASGEDGGRVPPSPEPTDGTSPVEQPTATPQQGDEPAPTAANERDSAAKATTGEAAGATAEEDDPFDWWLDEAEAEEEMARSAPPPIPPMAPPAPATVSAAPPAPDQQQEEALRAITWQAPDAPGATPASVADGAPEAGEQEQVASAPAEGRRGEPQADEGTAEDAAIVAATAAGAAAGEGGTAALQDADAELNAGAQPPTGSISAGDDPRASSEEAPAEAQHQSEPVQFTALYPKEVAVETWNTLLVYTHLAAALPKLRADALKFKDELGAGPRESHAQAGPRVARGTELTLVPTCGGVTFNPEQVRFHWVEDLHRAQFRFQAAKEQARSAGNGEVAIYAGPLLVATLKIAILFDESDVPPPAIPDVEVTADLYKQIFVSYSRKDTSVVIACRNAYKALGITVNMDIDSLRAGEVFDETLMHLIDGSDVFQLFWSERSAESEYVRQEWEYALRRNKGPGFIRPVYWQRPLVPPPAELARLHFAYVELPEVETPDGATA